MIKKILLFALVMFPVISFAQETKIAHVDYYAVIRDMPEVMQMSDSIKKSEEALYADLTEMQTEYQKKASEFYTQQDSLSDRMKLLRQQELANIQQNLENFQQYATQKQEELQQTLLAPIRNKLMKAINDVGAENKYTYIFNSNQEIILYTSPNAIDATPAVRKKLGL